MKLDRLQNGPSNPCQAASRMTTKRILDFGIFGIAFIAICLFICSCSSISSMRSEASIRSSLFRQTPLGSSYDDVSLFLKKKQWLDESYEGEHSGFDKQDVRPPVTVGTSSLCGQLGSYRMFPYFFETDVTAFWGFDANKRLIDIWVWKTTDGL
jgi:hypothetical protein